MTAASLHRRLTAGEVHDDVGDEQPDHDHEQDVPPGHARGARPEAARAAVVVAMMMPAASVALAPVVAIGPRLLRSGGRRRRAYARSRGRLAALTRGIHAVPCLGVGLSGHHDELMLAARPPGDNARGPRTHFSPKTIAS